MARSNVNRGHVGSRTLLVDEEHTPSPRVKDENDIVAADASALTSMMSRVYDSGTTGSQLIRSLDREVTWRGGLTGPADPEHGY